MMPLLYLVGFMDAAVFLNISKIIERDRKETTYKFALLRGVIDIISENSPYVVVGDETVTMPMGLMVERWLLYYYPIFSSSVNIPQTHGERETVAIRAPFLPVIDYYASRGGLSAFYNDLRTRGISAEIAPAFAALAKKIHDTIAKMPMKHIGSAVNGEHYSIFKCSPPAARRIQGPLNTEWLIRSGGTFTIPTDYYHAFRTLGSFISGTDSILFKWAEYSVSASGNALSTERVLEEVLKNPVTGRNVADAKSVYDSMRREAGHLHCVWSDRKLSAYDIDHVIPFVAWKNNDLWNLLPAHPEENNRKRDKIPTAAKLDACKDAVIAYWQILHGHYPQRFTSELRLSLLGTDDDADWPDAAFEKLKRSSDYLIHTRGYEPWTL